MNNVSTFLPSEYGAEAQSIARRRRLAEALQAQSMEPLPQNQMAGGYVVRTSPLQGLAQMLKGYTANRGLERADEQERALASKVTQGRQETLAKALRTAEGEPGRFIQPDPQEFEQAADQGLESPAGFTRPAAPPNRLGATTMLMSSGDPVLSQIGAPMLAAMLKDEKYGHDVKFTNDGRAYVMGDKGNVRFLGADVTPRDKLEFVNEGGQITPRNPYTANPVGGAIPTTMRPGEKANLQWKQFEWANPSAHQQHQEKIAEGNLGVARGNLGVARGNLGLNNMTTYFNTGMSLPGGVPGGAGAGGAAVGGPARSIREGGGGGGDGPQGTPTTPVGVGRPPAQLPPSMQGGGALTPKQRAELESERPKATAAIQGVMLALDGAINEAQALNKSHLGGVTGPVFGRLPSILPWSTNAQARIDTLKSQIGVQVLQAMRDASKTGGAVGNVTEREWPILQNQLGALQQSQTQDQFRANLANVEATLKRMQQSAKEAYESTYGPVQFSSPRTQPSAEGSLLEQADAIVNGGR